MNKNSAKGIGSLEAVDKKTESLNVVIETPKGSRNKYKFNEESEVFELSGILPLGMSFPFDFGFIPQTLGGDGDPLDVLMLLDESAFAGCLIPARLIGVIEANQTEDKKTERNDRLIAVAQKSLLYENIDNLDDLNDSLVEEIKQFFIAYNRIKGKEFEPLGEFNKTKAEKLVSQGAKKFSGRQR